MGRVGQYELLETVGRGATCEVKRVRHIHTGSPYVAKIVPKRGAHAKSFVKGEIEIMQRLKHRNIVQLIEVLQSANNYYIILEAVTGGDLCDLITGLSDPLPERDVAALLSQLIDGVEECHRSGVAHKDLKPENLLLTTDGQLKISDFGLSRLQSDSTDNGYSITGTLAYVAPEAFNSEYDAFRADIWSIGCIMYVLLTLNFPFGPASDPIALEGRIRHGDICAFSSDVSSEARDLCMLLLSPNPANRPSLEEIAQHRFFVKNCQ